MGLEDLPVIGLIIAFLLFLGVFGYMMMNPIMDMFVGMPGITEHFTTQMKGIFQLFDGIAAIVLAILLVGSIMVAMMARSNPVFAALAIITQGFFVIVGYALQLITIAFSEQTVLASAITKFPISLSIMSHFAAIAMIITFAMLVALYIKPSSGEPVGV